MKTGKPEVSVLMAVHNGARYLSSTIHSILTQSFSDFEFVIVDDGSTDGSNSLVSSFTDPRIRLISNETNLGLPAALNIGLSAASGHLVARIDAGDLARPQRLACQVAFMNSNLEVAALGTQVAMIDVQGRPIGHSYSTKPCHDKVLRLYAVFNSPINHPTAMYRLDIIREALGGYQKEFKVCEDYDLWRRLMVKNRIANLPNVLLDMRSDPTSLSLDRTHPRRREYPEQVLEISTSVAELTLGRLAIPKELLSTWVALFLETRLVSPSELPALYLAIKEIGRTYVNRLDNSAQKKELKELIAWLYSTIALNMATHERRASLTAYTHACQASYRIAGLHMLRYVGLLAGGEAFRRTIRKRRLRH